MRNKRTAILFLAAVCLVIVIAAAGGLYLRVRHGTYIRADKEIIRTERVMSYRQDNEEWAMDRLGESSYTMKSSGCLVTCLAAGFSTAGDDITPGELNAFFSDQAVYDGEGNILWDNLEKLDGYSVRVFDTVSKSQIDQCLEEGHCPIVRVRMHGLGNYHYVLIAGARRGDYVCMDPLCDRLTELSDYMGMVYAVRCVWREDDSQ